MKTQSNQWCSWITPLLFAGVMLLAMPLTAAQAQDVTLAGTVTLGTGLSGATVTAATVDPTTGGFGGMDLGSTITDSNGNFSISFGNAPDGPIRILATGGSFVSPQDGTTITSRNLVSVLLADVTGSVSGVSINPLTKFVNDQTVADLAHGTSEFATALADATATIEADYGLGSDPSTLMPDYTSAGIGTDAGNLGLILGGLANLDEHLTTPNCPPGGLATVLSADLADGVFDGANLGTPLKYCGVALPAIAGISDFQDALSGLYQLQLIGTGFVFGGTGNLLTSNGIAASQLVSSVGTIETALTNAAPPSVNSFAPPNQTPVTKNYIALPALAQLSRGNILIAGWNDATGQLLTTQIYNAVLNTFFWGPLLSEQRLGATATLLPNGEVLVAGGTTDTTTELYDPKSKTFVAGPPMNFAHTNATAVLMGTGEVLIAGGLSGATLTANVDIYNSATNSFLPAASTPTMNAARYFAAATLMANGNVLIAGGQSATGGAPALNSIEIYNPTTNTFATTTPSMSDSRDAPTVTALPDGKVLIAGGENSANIALTSTDMYDPSNNAISSGPSMAVGRWAATSALVPNGNVIIISGNKSACSGCGLLSSEVYDSTSNTISQGPVPNLVRALGSSALLGDGKVLIVGGVPVGGSLGTDLYTP